MQNSTTILGIIEMRLKASQLIDELNRAEAMDSYRETLAHLVSFDLLVIDDFRLMHLDLTKCRTCSRFWRAGILADLPW